MLIRLKRDAETARKVLALKRIHRVVICRIAFLEIAAQIQPAKQLNIAETVHAIGLEPLVHPGLVTMAIVDVKETLSGKMESKAGHNKGFVPVLNLITAVFAPNERTHTFEHTIVPLIRIKIQFTVGPSRAEAGSVIERGVHLKIFSVVLHLGSKVNLSRAVVVRSLRSCPAGCCSRGNSRLRIQESCGNLLPR